MTEHEKSSDNLGKIRSVVRCRIRREFPELVASNLAVCNFYADALFCALSCSFAVLRLRSLYSLFIQQMREVPGKLGSSLVVFVWLVGGDPSRGLLTGTPRDDPRPPAPLPPFSWPQQAKKDAVRLATGVGSHGVLDAGGP